MYGFAWVPLEASIAAVWNSRRLISSSRNSRLLKLTTPLAQSYPTGNVPLQLLHIQTLKRHQSPALR